jgi:uncharacterized repeat protein (TIGR01451 family)
LKRSRLLLALAIAACGKASQPGAPLPSAVTPPGAYGDGEVEVTIEGSQFFASVTALQNGGGNLTADAQFTLSLGPVALSDVRWASPQKLTAKVPASLPAGTYPLTVSGPYGQGTLAAAFTRSTAQPAQLLASATAPTTVTVGQAFDVSLRCVNGGQSAVHAAAPTPREAGSFDMHAVDGAAADIAGGDSKVWTWHLSPTVPGALHLEWAPQGSDAVDGQSLTSAAFADLMVIAPASLSMTATPSATTVSIGQSFTLDVTVANGGQSQASGVSVAADFGPSVVLVSAPPAQDVPAGGSSTFRFSLAGAASGISAPAVRVSATDATSGAALSAAAAVAGISVQAPPSLSLSAAPLPARISIGQQIDVALTVRNDGEATATAVQPSLQAGPQVSLLAAPAARDLPAGALANFVYRFQAASPGKAVFSASAAGADANSGATVVVAPVALGAIAVESQAVLSLSVAAPAQVTVGQALSITVTATNTGASTAASVSPQLTLPAGLQLVSSPSSQDIPGGASTAFVFGARGTAAGVASYTASAAGTDADSGRPVAAQAAGSISVVSPAQLAAVAQTTPASISIGETAALDVLVRNDGGSDATAVSASPSPGAFLQVVSSAAAQDIPRGTQQIFHFVVRGAASGSAVFSTAFSGADAASGAQVSAAVSFGAIAVQSPAGLAITAAPVLARASIGQQFDLVLTVRNTGEATANAVQPQLSTGTSVSLVSSPPAATIAGGASAPFSYRLQAVAAGTASLTASASGLDANSSAALTTGPVAAGTVAVDTAAALSLSVTEPAQVAVGQTLTIALAAANSGSATAASVTPQLVLPTGLSVVSSPAAQDLAGGASASLVYTVRATSAGTASFTASVAGVDGDSAAAVSAQASGSIAVVEPAHLTVTAQAAPAAISVGQQVGLNVVVQNDGGSDVAAVSFSAIPGAALQLVAGPATQDIPRGTQQTFRFTLRGAASGSAVVTVGLAGTDTTSGAAVIAGGSFAPIVVQSPAALSLAASPLPARASIGQELDLSLTVANLGEATAAGVQVQVDGGAAVTLQSAPSASDLVGGASATLVFKYVASQVGSATFTASATAQDLNSQLAISAGPVSAGPVTIETGAALSLSVAAPALATAGEIFPVVVTAANTGSATAASVLPQLTLSPLLQPVSSPPAQDLVGGASAAFTFQVRAVAIGSAPVTATAAATDGDSGQPISAAADGGAVLVESSPALQIVSFSIPPLISTGQSFTALMVVQNIGGATASQVTPQPPQIAGNAVVGSSPAPQDIAGGESRAFVWTLQAGASAGQVSLAASVSGADENTGNPVSAGLFTSNTATVQSAAQLVVTLSMPASLSRGQSFGATMVVRNDGDATAHAVLPKSDPPQAVEVVGGAAVTASADAPQPVDIPGHGSATFDWTFSEDGTGSGSFKLQGDAAGFDLNSGLALTAQATSDVAAVQEPASLSVESLTVVPGATLSRGQAFTATLVVRNGGEASAMQVMPTPAVPLLITTGGAAAVTADAAPAQDIAAGATATYSWTFVEDGTSSGSLAVSGGASGLDQNSGASVTATPVDSAPIFVQQPAALASAISAPAQVSRGQSFAVNVAVTNAGEAPAVNVQPGLAALPGGSLLLSATAPQTIPGGATQIFRYTAREAGSGERAISWSAVAAASDGNSGVAVVSAAASAQTTVDSPAALSVVAFTLPSAITRGTAVTAQLVVTNTGDATAAHVVPTTPSVQTTGGAGAFTSTAVAPVDLPGHQSATFSWTFFENGAAPGTIGLTTTVSAADANSALSISAAGVAGPVPVQDPSQLEVVSFTLPSKLSRGQPFTGVLTVRNTGGSTVNGLSTSTPTVQVTGGANAALTSELFLASLAPGQIGTLSYAYTENGSAAGTLQLAAVVTGTDAVSQAAVSSSASSNAAVVEEKAVLASSALILPERIVHGQVFTAQLFVHNGGGAIASSVLPGPLSLTFGGNAHATISAAPVAQDIAGGATATYTWTVKEDGAANGSISAATTAAGTDADSGAPIAAPPASQGPVPVEQPASLTSALTAPAAITRGQSFTVTLSVRNSGEAAASVVPGGLAISPAGAANVTAAPTAATVPGGASTVFSYTVISVAADAAASLTFSASATGSDDDSHAPLSAGPATATTAVDSPPALVISSFVLRSPLGTTAVNRGQTFTADLTVTNNGQAAASGVTPSPLPLALSATGGAAATPSSSISAATIPGGQSAVYHWTYAENGTADGTLSLSAGVVGTDANSGAALSAATSASNTLVVQNPAQLSAALSVSQQVGIGTSFTISLSVLNSGDATASAVAPALTVTGSASVVLVASPSPADIAGGGTATFQWTYNATADGSLSLAATATGTDANDGHACSAQASATTVVADLALIASDPFGDGSSFSYVFGYSGRVFVGPRSNGVGAISFQPDGSDSRAETLLFGGAADDLNKATAGPWPSLGYTGCKADTITCGPDNENGRADYYTGILGGQEVMVAVGTRTVDHLHRIYATSDTSTTKTLNPIALDPQATDGQTRGVTSMLAVGSRLYVGFAENVATPDLSFIDTAITDQNPTWTNLDVNAMPGVGQGNTAKTQLIDSMVVFNGLLYFANNGGCERSTVPEPQPYNTGLLGTGLLAGPQNWAPCTPSGPEYIGEGSVTTKKTTDFTPADRAVPQMAVYGGRLYLARNTTAGPQLWVCNPGADAACDPGDWSLIATNSAGDPALCSFNDLGLTSITLLAATQGHLYVGFDGTSGAALFRTDAAAPQTRGDFQGAAGCNAANHPADCASLGGSGLGAGATHLWSNTVMTVAGTDYLYVAAGDGASGANVFRVAQ